MALAGEVKALRDEVSRPLPSSQEFSESSPEPSESGTGGSGSSSAGSLTDSENQPIHSEHLIKRAEAEEIVKKRKNKRS